MISRWFEESHFSWAEDIGYSQADLVERAERPHPGKGVIQQYRCSQYETLWKMNKDHYSCTSLHLEILYKYIQIHTWYYIIMTEFSKNNKRTMVRLIPKFLTDNTEVKPAKRKEPSRSFCRGLQPIYSEETAIQTFLILPIWHFSVDDFR